jgi:uncharacterized membrane protein YdjX (TVP38/TMEM64 family)
MDTTITVKKERNLVIVRLVVLMGVIILISLLFIYRDQLEKLKNYGYAGIFLLSIAANATIIIPLPGVAITTAMGAIFNPLGVAVAAGLGASLGELSGYLAGYSGRGVAQRAALYDRLISWMELHKNLTYIMILILAFIPNPLFDLAGMAAGVLKLPLWKFFLACAFGKILKMLMFAYAGYYSITWLTGLFNK